MKTLLRVLGTAFIFSVIVIFIALNVTGYRLAQFFTHPPKVSAGGSLLREDGIEFQMIELLAEDGIKLRAFYTPPKNGAVILVAHGHAGTIPEDMYAMFVRHGYGVLAWDFRAHGKSGGDFTTVGYYEVRDVKAALDYALVQPGVDHIGVWGGSMGGVTAIRAAAIYPQIEAVVSDSAFDTMEGVFEARVPYPILRPFVRFYAQLETGLTVDDVRPVDEIGRISPRPVFLIQGANDTSIPINSAKNMYEAAGEPKFIWEGEKAYHLNMVYKYPEEYETKVIEFFDNYLK